MKDDELRYELLNDSRDLYRDIDDVISSLVKARLSKDEELEGRSIRKMESIMPGVLQHLDVLIEYLKG